MKKLFLLAGACMLAVSAHAQTYLPLTAGSGSPLSGTLYSDVSSESVLTNTVLGTSRKFIVLGNTGGSGQFGIESSAGGSLFTNGNSYALAIGTGSTGNGIDFGTNGTVRYTISQNGNHDFKSGTATFGSDLIIPNGNFYKAKRNDGIALDVLGFENGTGNLTMTASDAFSIKNTGSASLFYINANTKAATFGGSVTATGATFNHITALTSNITSDVAGGGFYHSVANAGMYGDSGYLRITNWSDGTKGLSIQVSTGNIGIGTTTPAEKLSVNGTIRSKEVKVETANWPDYVFEEDYKVETLESLEGYIKTNKHLPGIPSAKEVEKEGISLGEMNARLLEKIEEMTLHMIEMNKLVKEQGEKMKEQGARIKDLETQIIKKN